MFARRDEHRLIFKSQFRPERRVAPERPSSLEQGGLTCSDGAALNADICPAHPVTFPSCFTHHWQTGTDAEAEKEIKMTADVDR